MSIDQEIKLGDNVAREFEATVRMVADPSATNLVNRVGENIAAHSGVKMPCRFKILDTQDMDATAFPGGHVYVTRGLIMAAENESELAGALAHAMAHVAAGHTARLLGDYGKYQRLAAIPTFFLGHWSNLIPEAPQQLPLNLESLAARQRKFEEEADQLAMQYLGEAGYDPKAYVTLLQKLLQRDRESSRRPPYSFMPDTKDRIAASTQELNRLPHRNRYVLNTPEFDVVKARLQALDDAEKSQQLLPLQGQKRPLLERPNR